MRRILVGIVIATVWTVGLSPAPVLAKKCIDVFKPFYDCVIKDEDGGEVNLTLEYIPPVGPSENFTISFDGSDYLCLCQAGGSFNNPKFRDSKSFLCGTDSALSEDVFDAVIGKVGGKKIKKGQRLVDLEDGSGRAEIFECIEGEAP